METRYCTSTKQQTSIIHHTMFARILPKTLYRTLSRNTSTNDVPKFDCPNCKKPDIDYAKIVDSLASTGCIVLIVWLIFGKDNTSKDLYNDLMHERELHKETKKMLKICNETSELYRQIKKENEK